MFYLEYDVFKLLEESARLNLSLNAEWGAFVESAESFLLDVILEAADRRTPTNFLEST